MENNHELEMWKVKADSEQFLNLVNGYNADCLRSLALSLHDELEERKLRQSANERIYTEVHIQYSELEKSILLF